MTSDKEIIDLNKNFFDTLLLNKHNALVANHLMQTELENDVKDVHDEFVKESEKQRFFNLLKKQGFKYKNDLTTEEKQKIEIEYQKSLTNKVSL